MRPHTAIDVSSYCYICERLVCAHTTINLFCYICERLVCPHTTLNLFSGVRELEHLKARVCALAKRREEVFVANRPRPLVTDPDQPALLLLRALRDESHRFALSRLRRLRSKALFQ